MKAVKNQDKTKAALLCNYKLVKENDEPRRVTPSVFSQETLQSTEEFYRNTTEVHLPRILEWLEDDGSPSHHNDQPLFQPYPSELIFQNFLPTQTYTIPLVLVNTDKVLRRVKLEQQNSEYFRVDFPKEGNRVAPGLSVTFTVCFTPQENKDYRHRLVFVTEREHFEVPVRAIGPRAILDFRDRIDLPTCPVKGSTEKTHSVRNVGNSAARFQLHTKGPFSVTPSCGNLDVGEFMQVTVQFQPTTTGDHREDLLLHYHTGEDVYISLFGSSEEVNVHLPCDTAVLRKTFISMASVSTMFITNDSDTLLHYCWAAGPHGGLSSLRQRSAEVDGQKASGQTLETLLYHHEFSHDCITVEPAGGLVHPHRTAQFSIIFKPEEAKHYEQTIYCDVTGRQSQLPLKVKGEGIGPEIHLNPKTTNMKEVYMGSRERYMVQMTNEGPIKAPFRWLTYDTTFGPCFSFRPAEGVLLPEARQTVEISFHSRTLGSLCEDLLLMVTGRPQPLVLNFRGSVISPTFHLNVSEIDFGDVAFGFPRTFTCTFTNSCHVPMKFALRVLGDGLGRPSITAAQQVADKPLKSWRGHNARELHRQPVEFTISPSVGWVEALSDEEIKVTLCSNTVGRYRLALAVDVDGVGEEVMTVPINARCVVPEIAVETSELDFQHCFLNFTYERGVQLTNRSDLPACYGLLDQDCENPGIALKSLEPRGVIPPCSSKKLPLILLAKTVGKLHLTLRVAVLGSLQPPLMLMLSCVGRGPVVHLHRSQLHFGPIPVLTDVTKTLQLFNQSPIAAHFTTCMRLRRSCWRVDPSNGVVPPESQLEINVVAHLKDTVTFKDTLEVSVLDGHTLVVALSAEGTGTTIVSDQPLGPVLDLGTHLSHGSCRYHFKLTNLGQRMQKIFWKSSDSKPSSNQPAVSTVKQKKVAEAPSDPDNPVFSISPFRLELFPGCSADMVLTGFSNSTGVVRERLTCHSIIGQHGTLQHIISVDVICHFIPPLVKGSNVSRMYHKLVLENVSCLPLSMDLMTSEPFYLCEAEEDQGSSTTKSVLLGDSSLLELWVCFDPHFYPDQTSRTVDEVLKMRHRVHPQEHVVALHAEVHYPNIHISTRKVDFGCVVNCTRNWKEIIITNCSQLHVSYHWMFMEDNKEPTTTMKEEEKRRVSPGCLSPDSPGQTADDQDTETREGGPRVSEIFDILPTYGDVKPGDKQQVMLGFFGHENISKQVVARCCVDDGPTYELTIRGEASVINFTLQPTWLDFGLQLFHQVGEVEMTLTNVGKVGFNFTILRPEAEGGGATQASGEAGQQQVRAGRPAVVPSQGHVDGGAELRLRVLYLPGVPDSFERKLQLQVAFIRPQDITLSGVGVFPRISLSLPRTFEQSCREVMEEARAALEASQTDGPAPEERSSETVHTLTNEQLLHMEVEKLLVKKNSLAGSDGGSHKNRKQQKLSKFLLPEYLLDFGFVLANKVVVHTVTITNSGLIPVSFHADLKHLAGTGFTVDFERVKELPRGETHTFTVKCDPHRVNMQQGNVNVVLSIQVSGGPVVPVRLRAAVTVPAVTVSTESLQFDRVPCGMCQMRTIQLLNQQPVPCRWNIAEEVKPFKKADKFLPLHKYMELLREHRPPLPVFQAIPCHGVLDAGERTNVHIKFSPLEGWSYSRTLVIGVADSSQRILLSAQGSSEDPSLDLDPAVLELGPCLPLSTDMEAEVTVRNPGAFPVEFYILELDKQHQEEEKVLRVTKGYDESNNLLLPPRIPGEGLPVELVEDYKEHYSQLQDDELDLDVEGVPEGLDNQEGESPKASEDHLENSPINIEPAQTFISELSRNSDGHRLGELELTPVCRAIARHMGIDLSPEGLAARNRRGIAVIVHGAPETDKGHPAASLARHYGAASLSVDAVIIDALNRGSSPVSLTARRLFQDAVQDTKQLTAVAPAEPPNASDPDPEACPDETEQSEEVFWQQSVEAQLQGADVSFLPRLFTEQLMVDLLAERFQLMDCNCGLVIAGLGSVFTPSAANTLQVLLKAFNNRKHIYVVHVSESYQVQEAREKVHREAETEASMKGVEEGSHDLQAEKLSALQMSVDELQSRFKTYEHDLVQVDHILQYWDRVQGFLLIPLPTEEASSVAEDHKPEKQPSAGKRNKKAMGKTASPATSQGAAAAAIAAAAAVEHIIPHILVNVTETESFSPEELVKTSCLPDPDEVLDELGLGPKGPTIPPPVSFSIVPFPKEREPAHIRQTCFTFLGPSAPDEQDEQAQEDSGPAVTKSRTRSNTKDKERRGRTSKSRSKSPGSTDQHHNILEKKRSQSLTAFRWVVPPGEEVVLRIWFYSASKGTFHQTYNLELVGTQKQYQLTCRGVCTYPSICKDHMTFFAQSKKVSHTKEELQRGYQMKAQCFEFGPLLCSKKRDRYKEKPYPENTEKLAIHNDSSLRADVQFIFRNDTEANTFLLDPPVMSLEPGHKQDLTVWAYPTNPGPMTDSIICQVKDNPEVIVLNISCWGVRPEVALEAKLFHFDRVLLLRKESRSLTMYNKTALPAFWRLLGVEDLGDDEFSVPQDQGIIAPKCSFALRLHLKAKKPLHIKKTIRLEVSDVDKIVGVVQSETIQVMAEAYDLSFDIVPDFLDFGTIKVFEEARLCLKIKNRGKYEIVFKCAFEQSHPGQPKLDSLFKLCPQTGSLSLQDRSATVQVICSPDREISLREQPILVFQMIDPSIGSGGEPVTRLVIKVSVHAVFTRFTISPACDINFGPLIYGCRKSQYFTIENIGVFETQFSICRSTPEPASSRRTVSSSKRKSVDSPSAKSGAPAGVRQKVVQQDSATSQNQLTAGVFSVSPIKGTLTPGAQQLIIVDCTADQLGTWKQHLLIGLSGRDPSRQADGVPYQLLAEVCRPGILSDVTSIFEEHHLCHSSSQLSSEEFSHAESIYVVDENRLVFNKVLVGRPAQARLKLSNNSKVPCVLNLTIKPGGAEPPETTEAFGLSAATLNIPNQSHAFAVVTFCPQTMQLYSAMLEATMDGPNSMHPSLKGKVLDVALMGEGTLPSVLVLRPALRNRQGIPLMQFRRVLLGRRHALPLVLLNDGNIPAQVHIEILDEDNIFSLKAAAENTDGTITSTKVQDTVDSGHQVVHRASLRLNVNQSVEFEVSLCSDRPLNVRANMSLFVEDNQYSNSTIRVTGEAYQEMVSLGNTRRPQQDEDQEDEEDGQYDVLDFGECHVGCSHQESFTMTNHSRHAVKFEWPSGGAQVLFSPQVGHLHAGCSKEVTATFTWDQPLTLSKQPVKCTLWQLEFEQPLDEVADWDDRQRTVRWTSSGVSQQGAHNKVVQTDPEPGCSALDGSQWDLELRLSAVCDYVKFSCNAGAVDFKDTLLYQRRIHPLQMVNEGAVSLDFFWTVTMDSGGSRENQRNRTSSGSRPAGRSRPASTLRPGSALAGVVSLLTDSSQQAPFEVEPHIGRILPGATQHFSVRFAPVEVADFRGRALCSIPNLQGGEQPPCVALSGRSLLPQCHFDLEDSDYLSGNRRPPKFTSLLPPNIRVLEFCSVGLSSSSTRCFHVFNPTTQPFSFKWRCEDKGDGLFTCVSPSGVVAPGKKAKVWFQFVAGQQDAVESLWSFVTETLSVPFLCVGTAKEPLVYLDRVHLQFGEVVVGRKVEQQVHVVNKEDDSFHFFVQQPSLLCEDQQSRLSVQPLTGTLAPKQRLPLTVSFSPCREGSVTFKVIVKVKRRSELLRLRVKAQCFQISASVHVDKSDGVFQEVAPNHHDTLDFTEVGLSEQKSFNFLIANLSRFTLEVTFNLTAPKELLPQLEVEPRSAAVEVGQQLRASLFFCPRGVCSLQDVSLTIKVKHGPAFSFTVKGSAASTLYFSFSELNFGKCFLVAAGIPPPCQTLLISNGGQRSTSVQCQFTKTACLEVDFHSDVLAPGAVMEVPVTFSPTEARRYHQKLHFILNGCLSREVEVRGQGVEVKLEVEDPRQKTLKLGSPMAGQRVKKQVVVINRSSLELRFSLMISTTSELEPKDLTVSPAGEVRLAPGGGCQVDLHFCPQQPLPPFTAKLLADCSGLIQTLLTVQGCCQGMEIFLDQNHLTFGAVAQHCQSQMKLLLRNTGDVGARFKWRGGDFPPELSIEPQKGYISPGMDFTFTVTYAPMKLSHLTRYERLRCCVEGLSSDLYLTVIGSCIAASTTKEPINFACVVRSSDTQPLTVPNPTNQPCSVRPVIKGEHWSTAPIVPFEPFESRELEVTYRPMTMTVGGKKHQGSIFFSFPDGTGVLHALQGTADPPKEENSILRQLVAKTQHEELLPVYNWLSMPQRFSVLLEAVKPDRLDATVTLSGPGYIDVPALSTRDCKLCFHTYKEGQFQSKVTFRNEDSGEFIFYLLTFRASPPGVLSTVQLEAAVRRTASASVEVENPLSTANVLAIECKCSEIKTPAKLTVPGHSKGVLTFQYQPLRPGESTTRLTLSSSELGLFLYDLLLKALPPPTERTIHFSALLGSNHWVSVRVNNAQFKTRYISKVEGSEFSVEKKGGIVVEAGAEVSVKVCFEPHKLGESTGQLTLTSKSDGQYVFPMHGVCGPPKAQGPFTIETGSNISIPFKNVFLQTTSFSYQVDNPSFTVDGVEAIASKVTRDIQVSFRAPPGGDAGPWFGRLTVCCHRSEGHSETCSWVYYLKGNRSK